MIRHLILITLVALNSAGCAWMWMDETGGGRQGASSSLVDYLYPAGEKPAEFDNRIPELSLPLRVGLAFVPTSGASVLSEATKSELLQIVRDAFKDKDYVEHIEIIPDTYLRSGRGFDTMQQVARLYDADIMALVSYDQVAALGEKKSALLYWTIVGAYLIKGTENQVQTFVDTAVFDVRTRKLLFRAPGTDKSEESSTLNQTPQVMRETRETSFRRAMTGMTANLGVELGNFEQRLKEDPQIAEVTWQQGKGGGGGIGAAMIALLAVLAGRRLVMSVQRRAATA